MSASARLVLRGISLFLAGTALALVFASSAGAATFNARGSAEQVYVTGLPAGAGISLLDSGDGVVATRNANSLGGALFRNVQPGSGYRVRLDSTSETSDPLTVLTTQSAPPSTDVYNQTHSQRRLRLHDHPRRHQAGLLGPSADRRDERRGSRPSAQPGRQQRAGPDPDRVLGLRLREAGRTAERDRDPRQPDGIHGRRRQHARHGLLGWGVRLLRAAPEPRRLRRGRDGRPAAVGRPQQGRDARHLLRRHQPALHRPDSPPEPGRDRASLGDRRGADDALSGRHAQHRIRLRVGAGADGPRRGRPTPPIPTTAPRPGPSSASPMAIRPAGTTRTCTPRPPTSSRRSATTTTTCPRSPTRCPRSRSSTRSTSRSSWPASGPTSRRAGTARRSPST